jgi:sugar phosphate permease
MNRTFADLCGSLYLNESQMSFEVPVGKKRLHPSWVVAIATFMVLLFSSSVRGAITLLINPLMDEYGWSRSAVTAAASINLLLFGFMGPFASALMVRYGLRKVVSIALGLIAVGALLSTQATAPWHLWLSWGLVMGTGQGCLASVLAANVASAWFVEKRGMVSGMLTAAATAGQLIFVPLNAKLIDAFSWRFVSITIAGATVLALPLVLGFIRNKPEDMGMRAYGAPADYEPPAKPGNPIKLAFTTLADVRRSGLFWTLFGSFFICGFSTSGLVQVHFVPAAKDAGITKASAAGLLLVIGIFDLLGSLGSGWLTDRVDPRKLLFAYYALRGLALLVFDEALGHGAGSIGLIGVVMFYGLDWIATVPPTIALANQCFGRTRGPVIYGWLFAGHQLGGAIAAQGAARLREWTGSYQLSFIIGGIFCLIAALGSLRIRTPDHDQDTANLRVLHPLDEPAMA